MALLQCALQAPAGATGQQALVAGAQVGLQHAAGARLLVGFDGQGDALAGQREGERREAAGALQVAVPALAQAGAQQGGLGGGAGARPQGDGGGLQALGPGGHQGLQAGAQGRRQVGALAQFGHQVEGGQDVAAAGQGDGVLQQGLGLVGGEHEGALQVVGGLLVVVLAVARGAQVVEKGGVFLAAGQVFGKLVGGLGEQFGGVAGGAGGWARAAAQGSARVRASRRAGVGGGAALTPALSQRERERERGAWAMRPHPDPLPEGEGERRGERRSGGGRCMSPAPPPSPGGERKGEGGGSGRRGQARAAALAGAGAVASSGWA